MIFSKKAIKTALKKGNIKISPFSEKQIDNAHVDLRLGKLPGNQTCLVIPAKGFIVSQTKERVRLSNDICGFIEGRASLAKQGISIEQSSTFIEPGSNNYMTLEIFNASDTAFTLRVGQPIAKMYILKVIDTY